MAFLVLDIYVPQINKKLIKGCNHPVSLPDPVYCFKAPH